MPVDSQQALITCLEKHLSQLSPETRKLGERLHDYAADIRYSAEHWEELFSVSRYSNKLEEIARNLRQLTTLLGELPETFYYHADMRRHTDRKPVSGRFTLSDFLAHAEEAKKFVERYKMDPDMRTQASAKRNWLAASIAFECKRVWGAEVLIERHGSIASALAFESASAPKHQNSDIALMDQYERFRTTLLACSPNSQHHLRPGPFGRFLEGVFATMSIYDMSGNVVSAATALDSLSAIQRQEDIVF